MEMRFSRRSALLVALLLPGLWCTSLSAQFIHSYILEDTPHATNPEMVGLLPNTILTYDAANDLAGTTGGSLRLATLITEGQVDALSYGTDFGEEGAYHTFFFFSIRRTASGSTAGLPRTPLFHEPPDDSESDIFIVNDNPTVSRLKPGSHVKIVDENTGSSRGVMPFGIQFAPNLGLTGITGRPSNPPPAISNVGAFTYNCPAHARSCEVYFSVGRGHATYHAADVLKYSGGVVTVYQSATQLGLGPDDNIDALAIDATMIFGPAEIGWYSVDRASPVLTASPQRLSAADIFRFERGATYPTLHQQLYMTAESMGLQSHVVFAANPDAEIDSIGHIDPAPSYPCIPAATLTGGLDIPCGGAMSEGFYAVLLNEKPLFVEQGVKPLATLPPFAPGSYDLVTVFGAGRGGNALAQLIVEAPSSIEAVTGLSSSVAGQAVTWSWALPSTNVTDIWVRLNCDPPVALAATATSYGPVSLPPGQHVLEVHTRSGGVSSPASFASAFVAADPAAIAPDELSATQMGRDVLLEWENVVAADVTVSLNGVAQITVPATIGSSQLTIPTGYGAHSVSVRATLSNGEASLPTAVQVVVPLPVGGDELQSASFPGIDPAAIAADAMHVYVAARNPGTAYRYDAADLSMPAQMIDTPGLSGGFGTNPQVQGLATDGTSLYWIISERLTVTDLLGDNATAPLTLPGLVAGGGATIDNLGRLWVVDLAADRVRSYFLDGTPAGGELSPLEGGALDRGVAARPGGTFDVVQTDLIGARFAVALDASGIRSGRTPLSDGGRVIVGLEHVPMGSAGVASFYAIDSASNAVVEIASTNPDFDGIPAGLHGSVVSSVELRAAGPWPLPDDATPVLLPQSLAAPGRTIADVEVRVELTHGFVGDVQIELISPSGTVVSLRRAGNEGTLMRRHFDDVGSNGFEDANGTHAPEGPGQLSDFDGQTADGTWTLRATDTVADVTGSIVEWSLLVGFDPVVSEPFQRGDCNGDATVNIADAVRTLTQLFPGVGAPPPLTCLDPCDSNDDGRVDIADTVFTLRVLFPSSCDPGGCPEFAAPAVTCGADGTIDAVPCAGSSCP